MNILILKRIKVILIEWRLDNNILFVCIEYRSVV